MPPLPASTRLRLACWCLLIGAGLLLVQPGALAAEQHLYCRDDAGKSYWDQVIFYTEDAQNRPRQLHPAEVDSRYRRIHSGVRGARLFAVYRHAAGRRSYTIYSYHLPTRRYIKSHVHYVTEQSYRRNFREPLTAELKQSYQRPDLFALIPEKPDHGEIPIGWHKAFWQCKKIGVGRYYYEYLRLFGIDLLGGIS